MATRSFPPRVPWRLPGRLPLRVPRRALVGYGGALAARGLEVAGKFGLCAVAARTLGAGDSGLFFMCLTWVNFASTLARMGLERATTRHIAAELAVGNGRAARQAAVRGVALVLAGSLAVALLTALGGPAAARLLLGQPELAEPLALSALILPPLTGTWAVSFVLIGLGRGVAAQMLLGALPPLLALGALVAGLAQLRWLLLAYAGANAACCAIGLLLIARDWHGRMADRPRPPGVAVEALPTLWASARPFFVVEMAQATLLALPTLALGAWATPAAVGEFSIANRLTLLVNAVVVSVGNIAAPGFAEHHRLHEYGRLRRADRLVRLLCVALCAPPAAALMLAPHLFLGLLGSQFHQAAPALEVLLLGQLAFALLPCQDTMLAMTGHGSVLRRITQVQFLACCGLCATLPAVWGLMGTAVASTLCQLLYTVGCALAVRRVLPQLAAPATTIGIQL